MTALTVFLINLFTSMMKRYVIPRFGDTGVHVVVFALAFLYSIYHFYGDLFPGVVTFIKETIKIAVYAIAAYELLLKNIPMFKQ